jgi:hypothetical protein
LYPGNGQKGFSKALKRGRSMMIRGLLRNLGSAALAFMLVGALQQIAEGQAIYPGPGGGGGGGGTPGGSSGQVQYNSSGSFAGSSAFTYDGAGNLALGNCAMIGSALAQAIKICGATSGGPTVSSQTTAPILLKTSNGTSLAILDAGAAAADWAYFQGSQSFGGAGFINLGAQGSDSNISFNWNCVGGSCYHEFFGGDGALFQLQDSGQTSTDHITIAQGSGTGASTAASIASGVGPLNLKTPAGKFVQVNGSPVEVATTCTLASAATVDIGASCVPGAIVTITGTTNISSLGSSAVAGASYTLQVTGNLALVSNANLNLPKGGSIISGSGAPVIPCWVPATAGTWYCGNPIYAGGISISPAGVIMTAGNINSAGALTLSNSIFTVSPGELALPKDTASGTAPGAGALKITAVAGTNAGTCKIIAYAGTSTTAITIIDNVGSGC